MKFDFTLQQLIAYYRECYELDNKQLEIYDFNSKQITNRLIVAASKFLFDKETSQKVNFTWAEAISTKLRIYEKEIDLYACSYFFKSKIKVLGRNRIAAVPLFLTPLSFKYDSGSYEVKQSTKKTIINPSAIKVIKEVYPHLDEDSIYDNLLKIRREADSLKRRNLFQEFFNQSDLTLINETNRFFSQKKFKEEFKKRPINTLFPVIGLALFKKPTASRGVLAELKDIALENKFYPQLIESLFLGTNYNITAENKETIHVPVNLSIPQQNIIKSAYQNNITLAVGPPGTGKSFTIASIAVDAIANGKSVLIASKNDQALKVIAEKLEKDFGVKENIISSGEKYFVRKMRSKIQHVLNLSIYPTRKKFLKKEVARLEKAIIKLDESILKATEDVNRKSEYEMSLSELMLEEATFMNKIKLFFREKKAKLTTSLISEVNSIHHLSAIRKEWMRSLLRHEQEKSLSDLIDDKELRDGLKKMLDILDSDSGVEKESLFYSLDFSKILKVFPVWLVNLKELNEYLPLKDGVFDLVIIDEATQCDIASSIPLLFRGKRAVVVGDPKQLRHVSFISYDKQKELAEKYGVDQFTKKLLDYRNTSILDVVMETITAQHQVHYLDEHYRSMPDIVEFSNEEFYNSSLNIMTFKSKNDLEENIEIHYSNGERIANGVNQQEIDAIFEKIKSNIEQKTERYNVGIISPFANQVKEIQKQVSDFFSVQELNKIDLLIGTPYNFQGEERDEVHISFTVDNNTASNVYTYLNKEDVFNVAITRARRRQYIYVSINSVPHNSYHLLHRYIRAIKGDEEEIVEEGSSLDFFLNEVKDWLNNYELSTFVGRELAGVVVDLLVEKGDKLYAIDLVGYPGVFQATFPIEKYKTLYRMNVGVIVLPFSFWHRKNEECKEFLMGKMGLQ